MDHQAFAQLLGNYGEFFGAIAVFVTLVYVAVQVRQAKEQVKQNSVMLLRQAHIDRGSNVTRPILESDGRLLAAMEKVNTQDGTIELVTKSFMTQYDLTYAEALPYIRMLHQIFYGYEADFLSAGPSEYLRQQLDALLRFTHIQLFWQHERQWLFSRGFVEYVDTFSNSELRPGETAHSGSRV